MPLRIGCDLDGVLADMESALVREAETLLGPRRETTPKKSRPPMATITPVLDLEPEVSEDGPLERELHLTESERGALWAHVAGLDGFWESLEEIEPGSVARLATLAAERRWDMIFLTKRPTTAGVTAQVQSQRWLEAKGFRMPSVYVVGGSRGRIAAALGLDIVVDDTAENCVDVASDSKALTIAVFRNKEAAVPAVLQNMGIHVVRSTSEGLDLLVDIDSGVAKEPGAMERVMRTLGLKPRPDA
ncbi:MAG: hypothetical protein O2930_07725 [Acidobacteria bacterium]|nr:hypothetical protein [Acidobacteriota bacterium]